MLAARDIYLKIPFLNSCLWHSKSWDTFTIVVDLDEIFIYNYTKPNIKSLWDALKVSFDNYNSCDVFLVLSLLSAEFSMAYF
jgi:hypothetical protein